MRKYILFLITILFIVCVSCRPERDTAQRRGLMMPKKSELPRNSKKYVERDRNYSR